MIQRRYHRDPVIWIIFAIAVSVPSIKLTRLLRERDSTAPHEAPRVSAAGQPRPAPAPRTAPSVKPGKPAIPIHHTAPARRLEPTAPASQDPVYIGPADEADAPLDSSRFLPIAPTATPIVASTITPNGDVAAVLEESGAVTLWDIMAHRQLATFTSGLSLPKGRRAIAPEMTLARPDEMAVVGRPPGMQSPQTLLAIRSGGEAHVWNAVSGQRLLTVPHETMDVAWADLIGLMTLGQDGTMRVWPATSPLDSALVSTLPSPGATIKDVDSNLENQVISVASLAGVYVRGTMDVAWTPIQTSEGSYAQKVVSSANGQFLASTWSNGQLRLYSTPAVHMRDQSGFVWANKTIKDPRLVASFDVGKPTPRLLAFSRDGSWLATHTGGSTSIRLWPTRPGARPASLQLLRGSLRSMWFAPDGRSLVVGIAGERYLRSLPMPRERTE